MFHPYKKSSSHLRAAIFMSYKKKCVYCGRTIQQRDMQIDHIIPSRMEDNQDEDVKQYLGELKESGFIVDSIENYLPSCSACNNSKNNRIYTVANLRFFHELARMHVDEILHRIETLNANTPEFFYEPVNTEIWEEVDFSYQHNLSYAIMGYRLTPADVEACPRFPQVDRIKKQLAIVDYVIVQGETGCGKSISMYQAAYDLCQKGWKVYRYKATDSLNVPLIPHNSELSLFIIDDAQRLSEKAISAITEQARPTTKIILAKTISSDIQHDAVLLTNKDAVQILYENLLSRKAEIISIVHQCDKNVGINFFELPIERRLNAASKAKTPWQFNYILRGGWQTMKEQYQTIRSHRNCDLLAAAIALFQIAQLDSSVEYHWLCDLLQRFDDSLSWGSDDLHYLVKQKVVLSIDDVRIVHMESAAVIIAQFLQDSSPKKREVLFAIVEAAFLEKKVMTLGLVWLCNSLLGYSVGHRCSEMFISEKMISFAIGCLDNVQTSRERIGIAFFMEKVFNMSCEKNGHYYFKRNEALFLDWISHSNSETAYAYFQLINTLYNTDKIQHRKFVKRIDWTQTVQSMMQERKTNLYAWGKLLDRLTFSLSQRERTSIAAVLQPAVENLCSRATTSNISDLSAFLCSISHLEPIYVHKVVRKLSPVFAEYFRKDMSQAMDLFDFDFFAKICGMSLFGGHRATKEERETAETLVNVLPEIEFAAVISQSLPREWHRIHEIMCLVGRYNPQKAKEIVTLVDITRLSDAASDSWDRSYEIAHICAALHIGDWRIARHFIENNQHRLQTMYSPLAMIAPECAIRLFNAGKLVELLTGHWWDISFYALREIIKTDEKTAEMILRANIPAIINQVNDTRAIDFEDGSYLAFLQLVCKYYSDAFKEITGAIDVKKITDNWQNSYMNPKKKKQAEKRYQQFLELLGQYSPEQ